MKGGKLKVEWTKVDSRFAVKKEMKKEKKAANIDTNKPKRPPSAFFLFLEDFCKEFEEKHPNKKSVLLMDKWKYSMSDEEKAPYIAEAAKLRDEYDRKMEAYNRNLAGGSDEHVNSEVLDVKLKVKCEVYDEEADQKRLAVKKEIKKEQYCENLSLVPIVFSEYGNSSFQMKGGKLKADSLEVDSKLAVKKEEEQGCKSPNLDSISPHLVSLLLDASTPKTRLAPLKPPQSAASASFLLRSCRTTSKPHRSAKPQFDARVAPTVSLRPSRLGTRLQSVRHQSAASASIRSRLTKSKPRLRARLRSVTSPAPSAFYNVEEELKAAIDANKQKTAANTQGMGGLDSTPYCRLPNAFMLFMDSFTKEFNKRNPNNISTAVIRARFGSDMWNYWMTEEEKAPFIAKAAKLREEYDRMNGNLASGGGGGGGGGDQSVKPEVMPDVYGLKSKVKSEVYEEKDEKGKKKIIIEIEDD